MTTEQKIKKIIEIQERFLFQQNDNLPFLKDAIINYLFESYIKIENDFEKNLGIKTFYSKNLGIK